MASAAPDPWPVALAAAAKATLHDDPAALVAATLADAAGHAADAFPELLKLARARPSAGPLSRPALNEVTHCLASALEAVLDASRTVEAALGGAPRRDGEAALLIMVRDFLEMRP